MWLSEIEPDGATFTGPRTGARVAASSAPWASSAWRNWSRGSQPSWVGTAGRPRYRTSGVSSSGPISGWQRRMQQTSAGWRRAKLSTYASSSETSRWKRVRSGSVRAMSSVKKYGVAPSQP